MSSNIAIHSKNSSGTSFSGASQTHFERQWDEKQTPKIKLQKIKDRTHGTEHQDDNLVLFPQKRNLTISEGEIVVSRQEIIRRFERDEMPN